MHLSRIRIVPMLALALMMAIGSVSMAAAQSTPSASPENGAGGTPVENLGCWTDEPNMDSGYPQWSSAPEMTINESATYIATIETNRGTIVAELFAEQAPETVNNFVCLASEGYYDGVIFHRVILDFMIQTGDPTGTGQGGPGYAINDELPGEDLTYAEGVLAMANSGPNTGGSQFFINHADNSSRLDSSYAIFGQVTEGMDVVDTIARIPVEPSPSGEQSSPFVTMTVLSITITEQ